MFQVQLIEAIHQLLTAVDHVVENLRSINDLEYFGSNRGSEGVSAIGASVSASDEMLGNPFPAEHGANRKTATEALGTG